MGISRDGVNIKYENTRLMDVLDHIEKQSNIRFRVADALYDMQITVNIRAADWDSAVNILLKDFSRIEIKDGKSKLMKVI